MIKKEETCIIIDANVYRYLVEHLNINDGNVFDKSIFIKAQLSKLGQTYSSLDIFYELLKHWNHKKEKKTIALAIKLYILLCSKIERITNEKISLVFLDNLILPSYIGFLDKTLNTSEHINLDERYVEDLKFLMSNFNSLSNLDENIEFNQCLNKISQYSIYRKQLPTSIIYNFYYPRRNENFNNLSFEIFRNEIMRIILSSLNNENKTSCELSSNFVSEHAFKHLYFLELKKITSFIEQNKNAWGILENFNIEDDNSKLWFNEDRVNRYNDFLILSVADLFLPNWKIISGDKEILLEEKNESTTKFLNIPPAYIKERNEHIIDYSEFIRLLKDLY